VRGKRWCVPIDCPDFPQGKGGRGDERFMQHLSNSKKDHIYGLYYFENFSREDVSKRLCVSLVVIDEVLRTWVYSHGRKETP